MILAQVHEALLAAGHNVDRKIVSVHESIKTPGKYTGIVRLHKEVAVEIPFEVIAENAEELAAETEGVTFAKVNVDENPDVAMGLGIQAIPTLFLFRDGKAVDKVVGVQSKQALKAMIDRNR